LRLQAFLNLNGKIASGSLLFLGFGTCFIFSSIWTSAGDATEELGGQK